MSRDQLGVIESECDVILDDDAPGSQVKESAGFCSGMRAQEMTDPPDSSVIFVTKIKTRTRIIGRRFQRTRTRMIQKTKKK